MHLDNTIYCERRNDNEKKGTSVFPLGEKPHTGTVSEKGGCYGEVYPQVGRQPGVPAKRKGEEHH